MSYKCRVRANDESFNSIFDVEWPTRCIAFHNGVMMSRQLESSWLQHLSSAIRDTNSGMHHRASGFRILEV